MLKNMVLGFVRHALTSFGGFAIGSGYVSGSEYEALAGAVVTLVGVIWSAMEKAQAKPKE